MTESKWFKVAVAWMAEDWPEKVQAWLMANLRLKLTADADDLQFALDNRIDKDGNPGGKKVTLMLSGNKYKEKPAQPDFTAVIPVNAVAHGEYMAALKAKREGVTPAPVAAAPETVEDDLPF